MKQKLLLTILLAFIANVFFVQAQPIEKLKWINFSPYVKPGQNPNYRTKIPESQIATLLDTLKPYVKGIRTFGTTDGLERVPYLAKQRNMKVIVGIWLGRDTTVNREQINSGIKIGTDGMADSIIVGSEVMLRNDLTESKLIEYIKQVKKACPGIPVSCADVTNEIINHPAVVDVCDFIAVNIYPFWEGVHIDCAIKSFHQSYLAVKAISKGKGIFISETGWKTEGNPVGEAVPSLTNAIRYITEVRNWSKAYDISFNLFCAFDEPWKLPNDDGWGIFKSDATLKPGMKKIFDPITKIDTTWFCSKISYLDKDTLAIDFMPVIGSYNYIKGHVNHLNACDHRIAAYINVPGWGWVTKPTFANPSVAIDCRGRWNLNYTTGGTDQLARDICLFLIKWDYTPPAVNRGSGVPQEVYQKAIAWKCIHRDSIRTAKLTASSDTTCIGNFVTLTASGGNKYLWNTGDTTSSISIKPESGKNSFSVEISNGNGIGQVLRKEIFIFYPSTSLYFENSYQAICPGDTATISVSKSVLADFVSFKWNTGQTTPSIKVSPSKTTEYTLTGTSRKGCQQVKTATVIVRQPTTNQVKAYRDTICFGNSSTVICWSGKKFKWNTGDTTAQITVFPKTTQVYTVTVTTYEDCIFTLSDTVVVLPRSYITTQSDTIFKGSTVTLTAVGNEGSRYYWNSGAVTPSIAVKPDKTTTYTVQVYKDKYNCSETVSKTITVKIPVQSELTRDLPEFRLYPNPAKDLVHIDISGNHHGFGTILSMTGSIVKQFNFSGNSTISTAGLKPGFYIIELNFDNHKIRKKLVIRE